MIVRSGGIWLNEHAEPEDKLHVHWRLSAPATGDDRAELKEARRLATRIAGGDASSISAVHPLRWPGSWHRKATPRMCEIAHADPDREIDLHEALVALRAAAPAEPQGNGADYSAGDGEDWEPLLAKIIEAEEIYPSCPPLTMKFLRSGMNDGAVVNVTRAVVNLSKARVAEPQRWRNAYDKIPAMVRDGRQKIEREATASPCAGSLFDPWVQSAVPTFPFDVLPSVVGNFVKTQSAVIGSDPSAMAMITLGALSGAIDHRSAVKLMRHGDWWAHPRLWIVVVGEVSVKKTSPIDAATKPLEKHQAKLMSHYQAMKRDYERAKQRGDDPPGKPEPPPRWVAIDTTVEKLGDILARSDKGILIKRDELSGWIGSLEKYASTRGSAADRAFWLKAYDGGPYTIDRIARGETHIGNLSVSLLGGIQPGRLGELHSLASDGLLQRFIPVLASPSTFPQDAASDAELYARLVQRLITLAPTSFYMSDDALGEMNALRKYLFDIERASGGLAAGFQGFVGKLPGVAGSLALILHLTDTPETAQNRPINSNTLQNVKRLVADFIIPHALEFYRTAEGASNGDRLQRVASFILTGGRTRIVPSDFTAGVAHLRGLGTVDLAVQIDPLVAGGWLIPEGPIRAPSAWTVAPCVVEQFAGRAGSERRRKDTLGNLMVAPWAGRNSPKERAS